MKSNCFSADIDTTSLPEEFDIEDFIDSLNGSGELYAEIWIHRNKFPALAVLLNSSRGFLVYMRYEGDAGFSSRGADGNGEREQEFMLSNGQVDVFPECWTIDRDGAIEVLKEFALHGSLSDRLMWANDSGDGCRHPSDKFVIPE